MKLSSVKKGETSILGGKLTFVLALKAQRTIERVAEHMGLKPSELLRQIADDFIAENKEEIRVLENKEEIKAL